jgi:hypothetical protein
MKSLLISLFLFVSILTNAQDKKVTAPIKDSVIAQRYVFTPTNMMPQGSKSRMVDAGYELKVTKEKISCYLPYAGRAYNVNPASSNGPLDFSANTFDYTATEGKKNELNIVIKPRGSNIDVRDLQLTVYENGTAYLNANFNNRQPISFNGNVDVIKEKKKKKIVQ